MKALRYNVAATARDTQSTIGSGRGGDDDDDDGIMMMMLMIMIIMMMIIIIHAGTHLYIPTAAADNDDDVLMSRDRAMTAAECLGGCSEGGDGCSCCPVLSSARHRRRPARDAAGHLQRPTAELPVAASHGIRLCILCCRRA